MRSVTRSGALVLCGFLCVANGFAQGVYFETSNSRNGENGSKVWYMPHMLRSVDADNSVSIVRLDRGEIYSLDPANKTYTVMTFAEMKTKFGDAKAKIDKYLQERMKGMSAEQKKLVEDRMAALNSKSTEAKIEANATGQSKKIDGYTCREYIVTRNGKEQEHVWVTQDFKEGETMRQDLTAFQNQMAAVVGGEARTFHWFDVGHGFPLERDEKDNVETVTKIERLSVPSSEFEVPAGFKKVSNDNFGGGDD